VEKNNWQQSQNTQNKYELRTGSVQKKQQQYSDSNIVHSVYAQYAKALHFLERQDNRHTPSLQHRLSSKAKGMRCVFKNSVMERGERVGGSKGKRHPFVSTGLATNTWPF